MRLRVGGLLLGFAVLAGCSGSDPSAPVVLAPVAASAAGPTAVAVPVAARAETPQGAAEFARHFYAQIVAGFARREPSLVANLSAPGCRGCAAYIASMTSIRDKGRRVEGFRISIDFAVAPQLTAKAARVDVGWSSGGSVLLDADSTVLRREPAMRVEEQLDLVRTTGGWRVVQVRRLAVRA